jgi:hypothetical protein
VPGWSRLFRPQWSMKEELGIAMEGWSSGCSPLVTVMESSNFRDLYHSTELRRLNRPWFGRVLVQRQMCSRV